MNKLGIWAIAIAGAFVIGVLSANPVAEAVGGWKAAVADLQDQIDSIPTSEPEVIQRSDSMEFQPQGTGQFSVVCPDGEFYLTQSKVITITPPAGSFTGLTIIEVLDDDKAGNTGGAHSNISGYSAEVFSNNQLAVPTTIEISIVCVKP